MKTHIDARHEDPIWMDEGHKVVWNVRWRRTAAGSRPSARRHR
jgi:hypothetical protein